MLSWIHRGCRSYRVKMEQNIASGSPSAADPKLAAHLRACAACREALDDARLGSRLLHQNPLPVAESSSAFVMGVMASIREEVSRRTAPESIWRPLELLGSRFALVAAAALLMLSVYVAEFAPVFRPAPAPARTQIGATIPEPPTAPSNLDEVLISLAGRDNE